MIVLSADQPYPGLRPFEAGDAAFFFGREAQTRHLRQKLETSRLVAVVGRSGCGKSSLVRAGLIPTLAREGSEAGEPVWHIAVFKPQGRPIEELTNELLKLSLSAPAEQEQLQPTIVAPDGGERHERAAALEPEMAIELRRSRLDATLRRNSRGLVEAVCELGIPSSQRLLIVIDQFEEIFRFEGARGSAADEATAFVRLLTEAINARASGSDDEPEIPLIQLMLTMRLDFLGDCARFARLPEAISEGQFLVPTLSRAERRAAIEEPARTAGKTIRPEVTQRLLNEIGDDPDQLPVLQHVLMRTWQQAGASREITLAHYEETGGVKGAISRHADQIFELLPSEAHRVAAERLFKAISERDSRGRSIRRATSLKTIVDVVAADDEKAGRDEGQRRSNHVIETFRAPDCCFLMPSVDEALTDDTPIDISHESLLRGWIRLTGTGTSEGWIAEEDRNGRIWRNLLEAAENGSTLSSNVARDRQRWWQQTRPTAAWAARYGNRFDAIDTYVRNSAQRAFRQRFVVAGAIALALMTSIGALLYWSYETVQRTAEKAEQSKLTREHNELTNLYRENRKELDLARARIAAQERELDRRNRELDRTIRQVQSVVPESDQQARADLDKLLRQSNAGSDNVAQRAIIDPKANPTPALASSTGYMWIGSAKGGTLNAPDGTALAPAAVQVGGQYVTNDDIFLRKGPPDRANYAQQESVGIMPEGTRVQIVSILPPYDRASGEQFWAQVQVVKLALPTVFFQFSGGPRDQAQRLSRALQTIGYRIPGEERTSGAASLREVRYFFRGQSTLARELADNVNRILQQQGLAIPPVTIELKNESTAIATNPDGKLELWLELPSSR